MDVIWINRNYERFEEVTLKPNYIVYKFTEIKDIL